MKKQVLVIVAFALMTFGETYIKYGAVFTTDTTNVTWSVNYKRVVEVKVMKQRGRYTMFVFADRSKYPKVYFTKTYNIRTKDEADTTINEPTGSTVKGSVSFGVAPGKNLFMAGGSAGIGYKYNDIFVGFSIGLFGGKYRDKTDTITVTYSSYNGRERTTKIKSTSSGDAFLFMPAVSLGYKKLRLMVGPAILKNDARVKLEGNYNYPIDSTYSDKSTSIGYVMALQPIIPLKNSNVGIITNIGWVSIPTGDKLKNYFFLSLGIEF